MVGIYFTDDAIDDLRRIGPAAVPKILKKLVLLESNVLAGYPLSGDLTGFRKLIVGPNTWRIVYRVADDKIEICEVWAIGARADAEIYAAATDRVRMAATTKPQLVALSDVIERLGRAAGDIVLHQPQPVELVPGWLADRLIYSAGMARKDVAALDLREAVDLWTDFTSKPDAF